MEKSIVCLGLIVVAVVISTLPNSFGLTSDSSYVLDDGKNIAMIIDIDRTGSMNIVEILIDSEYAEYIIHNSTINTVRIDDEYNSGRIYGQTVTGEWFYMIFNVDSDDVHMIVKVWDEQRTKIISTGKVIPLF